MLKKITGEFLMPQYWKALMILGSGMLLGYLINKYVVSKLYSFAKKTKFKYDEIIIKSLRGMIFVWFTLIAAHLAILQVTGNHTVLKTSKQALVVLLILSITVVVSRIVVGFVTVYSKTKQNVLPSISLFSNIAKIIIYVIGLLIILQALGISITPLLTALGVGGLAVALALQDTLSNLFSGIQIILSGQLKPGDYIQLQTGEEGNIVDITWRYTVIKKLANNLVVIPNSKIASNVLTNFQTPTSDMSVLIQMGVSYASDLKKVEKVTMEVGKEVMLEVEGGVKEFEPFIRYHTFDSSSINFTVILRTMDYVSQYLIKHEFVKRLHERYKKEGIVIPFPIRTVYLRQPEEKPKS
jgi:small-conductance mechanosensitive channel